MGNSNNYIKKDLGITSTRAITSKEFNQMWSKYDRNKNRLTYRQAHTLVKDFCEAVNAQYDKNKTETLIKKADTDNSGYLNFEQFKKLFIDVSNSSGVSMTKSLQTTLGALDSDSDSDYNANTSKPITINEIKKQLNDNKPIENKAPEKKPDNKQPAIVFEKKKTPVEEIFEKYAKVSEAEDEDFDPNMLKGSGIVKFAEDLGIASEDPGLILIAWKLNVNQPEVWEFSKDEFLEFERTHGVKSVDDIKKKLSTWRDEIKRNQDTFDKFYLFTFDYLRVDKKVLPIDETILAWEMLGMPQRWKECWPQWKEYIESTQSAMVRDTWKMFGLFVRKHPNGLNNYDPNALWPSVIDEFVDHIKNPKKDQVEEEEEE